jgi:hypothetical protein
MNSLVPAFAPEGKFASIADVRRGNASRHQASSYKVEVR